MFEAARAHRARRCPGRQRAPRPQRGTSMIEILAVLLLIGILAAIVIPNFVREQATYAREAAVKSNVHATQLAAEDFAVREHGSYAPSVADLRSALPDTQGFRNPFTGVVELPQDGVADDQGEVGYVPSGAGYSITGFGSEGLVLEVTSGE